MIVYTITVIDINDRKNILGVRRTPAIFSTLQAAAFTVRNNIGDLSDGGLYLYAVIEESLLNEVRPNIERQSKQLWFRYNCVLQEYEPILKPEQFKNQFGFGIG